MKQLIEENEWMSHERDLFGKPNSFYDFEQMNINEMAIKVKNLAQDIENSKKRVNFKVDSMVDELNEKYKHLETKKETIEKDRNEMKQTVDFMNKKMHEEL